MLALLAVLVPILVLDVLNPMLFAMLVVAGGSRRPVLNGVSLLIGHTAAYFVAGIAAAYGLEQISDRLQNPQQLDYALGGMIGAFLVGVFFSMRGGSSAAAPSAGPELSPLGYFGLGAVVNFVGVPFALPYFGAIDQILKADLGFTSSLFALALYNLAYALLFAIVPASLALAGDGAKPILERINRFLDRASDAIIPWLILLLGIWLLFDAARYFIAQYG